MSFHDFLDFGVAVAGTVGRSWSRRIAVGSDGSSEFFNYHGSMQVLGVDNHAYTYFEFAMYSVLLVESTAREQTHVAPEVGEGRKESELGLYDLSTDGPPTPVVSHAPRSQSSSTLPQGSL